MAAKTRRIQVRMDDATEGKIRELARAWGPYEELTPSAVVRQCVEMAHQVVMGEAVSNNGNGTGRIARKRV